MIQENTFQDLQLLNEQRKKIFYPKTDLKALDQDLIVFKESRSEKVFVERKHVIAACVQFFQEVPQVYLIAGGTFHEIYKITLSSGKKYIFRARIFMPNKPASEFYLEKVVLDLLHEKELTRMLVHYIDLSRMIVPFDYLIQDYVEGTSLRDLQDPKTQFLGEDILFSLGVYLAKIHQIKLDGFGLVSLEKNHHLFSLAGLHDSWESYLFLQLSEHVELCYQKKLISVQEKKKIVDLFSSYKSMLDIVQKGSLLHGDLGGHNIFSNGKNITGIIDWEDALIGDPIFDIAYWGTFYRDHQRELLLRGYESMTALPNDFEVRYWLYYLRVALSKTVHRIRFGYKDHPARPPASLRIQKAMRNLNALDL